MLNVMVQCHHVMTVLVANSLVNLLSAAYDQPLVCTLLDGISWNSLFIFAKSTKGLITE
jgi:hypothetical protein